jgi:hypothetical protein
MNPKSLRTLANEMAAIRPLSRKVGISYASTRCLFHFMNKPVRPLREIADRLASCESPAWALVAQCARNATGE